MPNVHPSKSSPPPVGGHEEGPQHSATVTQVAHSTPKGIYSGVAVEKNEECTHEKNREDVIKEIALSSTAFIGPVCRPETAIEKEMNDFYKELEELNHQDSVDGHEKDEEGIPQSCAPAQASHPFPRKEAWVRNHKNVYRPYPAARPQRDFENNGRWRPPSYNDMTWGDSYKHENQWHHLPPGLPHRPPSIRFHGAQHFFPPLPPRNPMQPPYFQTRFNNYSHADKSSWSSWEEPHFSLGDDIRTPHNCLGSVDQLGTSSYDRQYYMENCHEQDQYQHNQSTSLVLILMRGVPGSGKSTLAKEILSTGPNGLILSTDDYFFQEDGYHYDPTLLRNAHEWNQNRTKNAMLDGCSPVIIDNTNVQAWEMKPYVALALEFGYRVEFVEPDTNWKCDPVELEKRNSHGVPRETIAKMLDRFELPVSVDIVMNSREPHHKSKEHLFNPRGRQRFNDM